ncbi:polysaccharide deacetylase family protein [Streptomyces avicenniae]|uniref:polysaccharide deacetylase family protein n=1 Tax=Streptomyces avicenniae TaxID=500153 RepID=UPI000699A3FE|nr:polysaccharide deacetylase family protein [Streptomyces avicenniae]
MPNDTSDGQPARRPPRRLVAGVAAGLGLIALNRYLVDSASAGGDDRSTGRAPRPAADTDALGVRETLPGTGRRLALTFDDGPHPVHTRDLLATLRAHAVRATFFVAGEHAAWQPALLRAIADDGHLLGNHTWSHPRLDRLPEDDARDELARTSAAVESAVGAAPVLARAPYGAWTAGTVRAARDLGMLPLGWSLDTGDWERPGTAEISRTLLDGARPGAIVLAHDGGGDRTQTVAALGYCLPRLLERGYALVLPTD